MGNILTKCTLCIIFCVSILSNAAAVEQHLGEKSAAFCSAAQSKALLTLIANNPNDSEARITYTTEVDMVVMEYFRAGDSLSRIHQRNDGTGTTEVWNGDVLSRLKNSAAGGSLNDTSRGKKPGSFSTF